MTIAASPSIPDGGPPAGVIFGGFKSTPMYSSTLRISAPLLIKAMMRIGPKQCGQHSSIWDSDKPADPADDGSIAELHAWTSVDPTVVSEVIRDIESVRT